MTHVPGRFFPEFQPRRVLAIISPPFESLGPLVACQHRYVGEVFCSIAGLGGAATDVALDLLAGGLDPALATIYRRCDIPEMDRLALLLAAVIGPSLGVGGFVAAAGILALQATDVLGGDLDGAARVARSWNGRYPATMFAVPEQVLDVGPAATDGVLGRRAAWASRLDDVEDVLRFGAWRVRREAGATLEAVREAIAGY